jgi:hypothetical protein
MSPSRRIIWTPNGPAGVALALIVMALVVALVVALLLIIAVVAELALVVGAVGGVGYALHRGFRHESELQAVESVPVVLAAQLAHPDSRPLERYLSDIEAYDELTTQVVRIEPERAGSWAGRRRLERLARRVAALRESAIEVERAVSLDLSAEPARPGLWELVVATTALQRYLRDLLAYPSSRGRGAQARELQALHERRQELVRRRDQLIFRLQQTDLGGNVLPIRPAGRG